MTICKCVDFKLLGEELNRRLKGQSLYGAAEAFRMINQIRSEMGIELAKPEDRIEDTLSETEELLEARLRRRIS